MKEFEVKVPGTGHSNTRLQWFGISAKQVKKEATDCGHKVLSVRFIRQL